jgi:hypothetical protein
MVGNHNSYIQKVKYDILILHIWIYIPKFIFCCFQRNQFQYIVYYYLYCVFKICGPGTCTVYLQLQRGNHLYYIFILLHCNIFLSLLITSTYILHTTLCDKLCQWLLAGRWFSLGTLVFSTNETDDLTEIFLKVALKTIILILILLIKFKCTCTFR